MKLKLLNFLPRECQILYVFKLFQILYVCCDSGEIKWIENIPICCSTATSSWISSIAVRILSVEK